MRSIRDRARPVRARERLRSQRGASPIELAILMPVILFMLFGAIQIAAVYMARATALSAAQTAVGTQRLYDADEGSGRTRALAFIQTAGDWLTKPTVTVVVDDVNGVVSCDVTGNALTVVPGWTITVTQSASGPIERVTAPGGAP
ncbi:TadE family protein [Catenuloplanes indicus]|uniref:Flp pilus assembly protein TadG n=1 Tax=Catenuloplanes indicus TaxID=137267 RepID=A0AAE3VZJ8_9ACTN|nr:TadE family protein [Catenuloplanes indicus]MDQ0366507.1 Flp pilus assembly protein TadG [Catenuloplanes indicus]